jgi:hypothetical protein
MVPVVGAKKNELYFLHFAAAKKPQQNHMLDSRASARSAAAEPTAQTCRGAHVRGTEAKPLALLLAADGFVLSVTLQFQKSFFKSLHVSGRAFL